MLVPFFFRLKLAPEQGVVVQHACGLPSARASASSTYVDRKFKEYESRGKELASHALAPVCTGFEHSTTCCGGRIEINLDAT